jgi:hypothetical protein
MMKNISWVVGLAALFTGAQAFGFSGWDEKNKPELFEFDYDRNFKGLPLTGQLQKLPWSGYYWPTNEGGITYRWNKETDGPEEKYGYDLLTEEAISSADSKTLSPAEKFDIFIGQTSFPLTNYERNRTNIMKTVAGSSNFQEGFKIPTWEGLCHAWAPATLAYDNPEPVTLKGENGKEMSFGSSDIKALLTYHLHNSKSPKTSFLGSRCNFDFKKLKEKLKNNEITKEEYEKSINAKECTDTNAGAFHIVLANQIAKRNQGFIVDVTRDFEVWNQPVIGYVSQVLGEKQGASEKAALGTVKEVTIRTWMQYVVEVRQGWEKEIVKDAYRTITYDYRLELNNKGEIIGGEWLSETRPDFIWKQQTPKFSGFFKDLEKIYKKSVSYLEDNSSGPGSDVGNNETEEERLERERREREEAARLEAERREREEAARLEAERREREEAARLEAERREREEAARLEAERREREDNRDNQMKVKEALEYGADIRNSSRTLARRVKRRIARHIDRRGRRGARRMKRSLRIVRRLFGASERFENALRTHRNLDVVQNEFRTLRRVFMKVSRVLRGGPRIQDELDYIESSLRSIESLYY